jgi:hypothetical protein
MWQDGAKALDVDEFVAALVARPGEVVAYGEAVAADKLEPTTRAPMFVVFLMSRPTRSLWIDALAAEMKHATPRKLTLPGRPGGDAVVVLVCLGPDCTAEAVPVLRKALPLSDLEEVSQVRERLPTGIAHVLGQVASGIGGARP